MPALFPRPYFELLEAASQLCLATCSHSRVLLVSLQTVTEFAMKVTHVCALRFCVGSVLTAVVPSVSTQLCELPALVALARAYRICHPGSVASVRRAVRFCSLACVFSYHSAGESLFYFMQSSSISPKKLQH